MPQHGPHCAIAEKTVPPIARATTGMNAPRISSSSSKLTSRERTRRGSLKMGVSSPSLGLTGKPNVLSRPRRSASRAALLRCSDARYVRSVVIQLGLVDINRRIRQDLTAELFNPGRRIFE
jgi:hypothetical protein